MKNLFHFLIFAIFAAAANAESDEDNQPAPSKVEKKAERPAPPELAYDSKGSISLPADIKSRPIYFVFKGSPKLTSAIQGDLAKRGYAVVHEASPEAVQVTMEGLYTMSGGKYGRQRHNIGEMIEKAASAEETKNYRPKIGSDIGYITVAAINPGNISSGYLGPNLIAALVGLTGVTGRLNEKIAGDPRGFCLFNCENWNKVSQFSEIAVQVRAPGQEEQTAYAGSRLRADHLYPDYMIPATLDKAMAFF